MTAENVLNVLFPQAWQGEINNDVLQGVTQVAGTTLHLLGCVNGAALGLSNTLDLARAVQEIIATDPGAPILLLVDTNGQAVSHNAELLGLNRYFSLVCKSFFLARAKGHRVIALVYGQALGGAFIASGLNADTIFALPEAKIAVMWLEAMARVTKIPLNTLQTLSQKSAILAPGAASYEKLGILQILPLASLRANLPTILATPPQITYQVGAARGGRLLAKQVIELIDAAAP